MYICMGMCMCVYAHIKRIVIVFILNSVQVCELFVDIDIHRDIDIVIDR